MATAQPKRERVWLAPEKATPFTEETARHFDAGYSEKNAQIVAMSLECDCEPYVDVLTFKRWKALGRSVKKGETSIKLAVQKEAAYREEGSEGVHHAKVARSAPVFCRCQTEHTSEREARRKERKRESSGPQTDASDSDRPAADDAGGGDVRADAPVADVKPKKKRTRKPKPAQTEEPETVEVQVA